MFGKTKGCSILLKDVRYNQEMFDLKDAEIKDEEAEMIVQKDQLNEYFYHSQLHMLITWN